MYLKLKRYSDNKESTLGLLYVDGRFECYTIEDTHRDIKVSGQTRIPSGTYEIKLRNVGGMTKKYKKKFPNDHIGMLHLQNVFNFKYVYIHIGNKATHSEGCILVGDTANNNEIKGGFVGGSGVAYLRLYKKIVRSLKLGENGRVFIEVKDEDI